MRLGSLFDGSGTAPLAASMCGIDPVWASEIEPYPIAVTKARFPHMLHLGSITEIDGGKVVPVDIICGGSPCQDLSVAGKQAGLHEGTRSHLFFEMTRIITEMREATNGKYPRYIVWENVPGAFSSNNGRDFHAVLQAFAEIADPDVYVPEPENRGGQTCLEVRRRNGRPRLEHCMANSGRAILGSTPAPPQNLPCGRFWKRTCRRSII